MDQERSADLVIWNVHSVWSVRKLFALLLPWCLKACDDHSMGSTGLAKCNAGQTLDGRWEVGDRWRQFLSAPDRKGTGFLCAYVKMERIGAIDEDKIRQLRFCGESNSIRASQIRRIPAFRIKMQEIVARTPQFREM